VVKRFGPSLGMAAAGVVFGAGSLGTLSCYDPVHDQEVAALGGEAPGVPQGPLHRPGQPCNVCHGGIGPASLRFSVAGTVYLYSAGSPPPAVGAQVQLQDSTGSAWHATTNTAGNFFVVQSDWAPTYPLSVPAVVDSTGKTNVFMSTLDNREGSCAACHGLTGGPNSAGPVYLNMGTAPTGG
jgi:hypothetical protein